ncbi:MAG: hypothetical protein JEZ11_09315 [Desulfobacterales bacterium]|nr:hypothetical protein [Desulfobacterales bacterium]
MRILVVDGDAYILDRYRKVFCGVSGEEDAVSPFSLQPCQDGNDALALVRSSLDEGRPFAVAFLGLNPGADPDGLVTVERIRKLDSNINFVIATELKGIGARKVTERIGPADKLLFVQTPPHDIEIRQLAETMGAKWTSERMLRQACTELKGKIVELEYSRQSLTDHKSELEYVNNQLIETNDALSVLARNLENARKESERQVLRKTRTLIIPTLDKLRQDRRLAGYRTDLDLLAMYVENLTSDISDKTRNAEMLSTTESRIASMIRLGLTSEDIADHLSVSVSTVKTHRKNIRRKLKLKNTGKNLRSYLESRLSSD